MEALISSYDVISYKPTRNEGTLISRNNKR
jgi:hypothetical protein